MPSKYPIMKPSEIIKKLDKRVLSIFHKKEVMPSIAMVYILI